MNLLSPIINYNYGHNTHALLIIMIIIHGCFPTLINKCFSNKKQNDHNIHVLACSHTTYLFLY